MRVLLRADASAEIGSGHVMRQLALAEELIRLKAEVLLVGHIDGIDWLPNKVRSVKGLHYESCEPLNFDWGYLTSWDASVAVVDSYQFDQEDLLRWEEFCPKTFVFLDGPWQELSGHAAIVPVLIHEAGWITELRSKFTRVLAGPQFLILRREIKEAKSSLDRAPRKPPKIVVALGATDLGNYTATVLETLDNFSKTCRIVYLNRGVAKFRNETARSNSVGFFDFDAEHFVSELKRASLVISATGTTVGELLYLGIPSIFIPVTGNQIENATALESLGEYDVIWPNSPRFVEQLRLSVDRQLEKSRREKPVSDAVLDIDGEGASRLASLMLGSV